MFKSRLFTTHHSWEDWLVMALGVVIALSPWLAEESASRVVVWNSVLVGVLVFFVAQLEYVMLQRWEETCELVLGLWLVVSPYVLGYSGAGTLRFWHAAIGGLIVLIAVLELWQDWDRSDQDMSRRGNLFGS